MNDDLLSTVHTTAASVLLLAGLCAEAEIPVVPNPGTDGLPPRTLPTGPALCAAVPWTQTDLLIAHLPPADWRQIQQYVGVGYQVIAVNTLAQWDRVGPRADDYPAHVVQDAESYLRRFVKIVHDGGAKAVFYLGPVQSPLQSPVFREKHPEWLRVNEDGSRSSDFVNFRNPEVIDWLCRQLACLARDYGADGFWFDGYSPVSLHTYDKATREAFGKFSHGADIPAPGKIRPEDPVSRLYLQWHEAYFAETADRIRRAVRTANPNCVIYGNTYISAMLVNAMRWVAQDAPPPVEVDGPLLLGTTFRRQRLQNRVVVHLLNDQSSYGRHSSKKRLRRFLRPG